MQKEPLRRFFFYTCMKIRLMTRADIPDASRIIGDNYSPMFAASSRLELRDMFRTGAIKPIYYVAEERGVVVGLVGFMQSWMDYNVYQIFWVNVAQHYQGHGIGTKLVAKAIREIRKQKGAHLILLTADKTAGLPTFYRQRFGFRALQSFSKDSYALMALSLE